MQTPSTEILIRCDGSTHVGLGHVIRCLALAVELREKHGLVPAFAVQEEDIGAALIREKNFIPYVKPKKSAEAFWLNDLTQRLQPRVIVLDIRTDLDACALQNWRNAGKTVVIIDELSPRRLAADMVFLPPVPQVKKADWTGFTGQLFAGWEWIILRREFSQLHGQPRSSHRTPPTVLITMGGSDPANLTLLTLRALDALQDAFKALVVLGPSFAHEEKLALWLRGARRTYDVRRSVHDMATLLSETDLAVASFGATAYELATMGVPAIFLCLTDDHAASATALVRRKAALSLGQYDEVDSDTLSSTFKKLLDNPQRLQNMSDSALSLIDGRGAERIAMKIKECLGINHG